MNIFTKFIDIIYPPRCHICRSFLGDKRHESVHFCDDCLEGFTSIRHPLCPICGRPFDSLTGEDHLCELCLRNMPFYDALGAPYLYEGGIMEAIHQLKYAGKTHLADSLGMLLASFAKGWLEKIDGYLMMPVPLHRKRLRERGFNQSLLIAKAVKRLLGGELDFLSLRRIRYTRPQTGLNSDERRKNVRQAFDLLEPEKFDGKNVILLDDVATTGNTMNECARVLKKAHCDKVFCLTLARTAGY